MTEREVQISQNEIRRDKAIKSRDLISNLTPESIGGIISSKRIDESLPDQEYFNQTIHITGKINEATERFRGPAAIVAIDRQISTLNNAIAKEAELLDAKNKLQLIEASASRGIYGDRSDEILKRARDYVDSLSPKSVDEDVITPERVVKNKNEDKKNKEKTEAHFKLDYDARTFSVDDVTYTFRQGRVINWELLTALSKAGKKGITNEEIEKIAKKTSQSISGAHVHLNNLKTKVGKEHIVKGYDEKRESDVWKLNGKVEVLNKPQPIWRTSPVQEDRIAMLKWLVENQEGDVREGLKINPLTSNSGGEMLPHRAWIALGTAEAFLRLRNKNNIITPEEVDILESLKNWEKKQGILDNKQFRQYLHGIFFSKGDMPLVDQSESDDDLEDEAEEVEEEIDAVTEVVLTENETEITPQSVYEALNYAPVTSTKPERVPRGELSIVDLDPYVELKMGDIVVFLAKKKMNDIPTPIAQLPKYMNTTIKADHIFTAGERGLIELPRERRLERGRAIPDIDITQTAIIFYWRIYNTGLSDKQSAEIKQIIDKIKPSAFEQASGK